MKRMLRLVLLAACAAIPLWLATAQTDPTATLTPTAIDLLAPVTVDPALVPPPADLIPATPTPAVVAPPINLVPVTVDPNASPTPTPTILTLGTPPSPTPTVTVTLVTDGTPQVLPTLVPTLTPTPAPPPLGLEATEALPTVITARTDLELLADRAFGEGIRPPTWSGSLDVTDNQLPLLVRIDLENMIGTLLTPEERPTGWFGVVPSSPLAVARDLRHDIELLADLVMGAPSLRPAGWQGDDPIMRCSRSVQALVGLLARSGYAVNIDFSQPTACAQLEVETSRFVETQIIQPSIPQQVGSSEGGAVTGGNAVLVEPFQVTSQFVVAFGDRNARERLGVIPLGTGFRPVARSYFGFSNMMLVRGVDFQVFVDYTTTSVPFRVFETLPDIDQAGSSIDCDAAWCEEG